MDIKNSFKGLRSKDINVKAKSWAKYVWLMVILMSAIDFFVNPNINQFWESLVMGIFGGALFAILPYMFIKFFKKTLAAIALLTLLIGIGFYLNQSVKITEDKDFKLGISINETEKKVKKLKDFKDDIERYGYHSGRILGSCTALQYLKQELCPGMKAKEVNVRLCVGYVLDILPKESQKTGADAIETMLKQASLNIPKSAESMFTSIFNSNHKIEGNRRQIQSCDEVEIIYKGELIKSLSVLKSLNPDNLKF